MKLVQSSFLVYYFTPPQILVVAAGVFNMHDPSDLLPELQSRLPIRVQLKPFTESQYMQIVPMLLEQQVYRPLVYGPIALVASESLYLGQRVRRA
jgi:ATP-dependent protease HslVU (ClpYQ) ATPase subunit